MAAAPAGELRYRVGGAAVAVVCRDVPLFGEWDAGYLPFLDRDGEARPDVTVELRLGEPSLPVRARQLFEAGGSWTLHALGESLLIAPHVAPAAPGPDWVAEIGADRRRVRVTCGSSLLAGAGPRRLLSPFHYPLDQILLSLALAGEGLIVHAAGVELDGRGLLLAGASGAGKTTISRLCAAASRPVLADDRVIVRRTRGGWRLFGTPWPGEGGFAENRGVELSGIGLLLKADENRARPLRRGEAARRLLPLASVPWYDRRSAEGCLDLVEDLVGAVPAFEVAFRPDAGALGALAGIGD